MKTQQTKSIALLLLLCAFFMPIKAQDATAIVKRADDKMRGEKSSYSVMEMKIIRPSHHHYELSL